MLKKLSGHTPAGAGARPDRIRTRKKKYINWMIGVEV